MRLNVRAHLLPMRILFTVCGALASMLRTQLRILLHVFVLVTSCAGWLAGLGGSTRVGYYSGRQQIRMGRRT